MFSTAIQQSYKCYSWVFKGREKKYLVSLGSKGGCNKVPLRTCSNFDADGSLGAETLPRWATASFGHREAQEMGLAPPVDIGQVWILAQGRPYGFPAVRSIMGPKINLRS